MVNSDHPHPQEPRMIVKTVRREDPSSAILRKRFPAIHLSDHEDAHRDHQHPHEERLDR